VHGTIASLFRVEWRPLAELAEVAAEWRALAARALEPNVFYEPACARAAAPGCGRDAGAGLVWSSGLPRRLVGFFPARIERRRYGIALPVLVGWTHPYAPLGTPLVDRDATAAVIAAWFEHLASHPDLPSLVLMPYLPLQGPLAVALDGVLAARGSKAVDFARHLRALLMPEGARAGYLDRALGRKKRKELRRQRNRLGGAGVVTRASASEPAAVTAALGDFLRLEAGGWKGRAGTAARADGDIAKFLETAVADLAGEGKARIERLLVDARAVAAIVVLRSGTTAWCWKIAYDESFARASPGVQLLTDVTQMLLDDPAIARADSCATQNHPMIDHVWRERLVLTERLVCIKSGSSFAFALACALEAFRHATVAAAKSARDLLRRSCVRRASR
jgi:CelD/BcsL family acetyltransferase involved in cellulose biosynthesis